MVQQNEFLDIVVTMDLTKLRRPLDPDVMGTGFTSTEYTPTGRK